MEQEFKFPIVAFGSNTNLDDLDRYALLHGYPTGCLRFSRTCECARLQTCIYKILKR